MKTAASFIANGLSRLLQKLQTGLCRFVVRPVSHLLDRLDPLAGRLDGPWLKRVLQVSVFTRY